MQSSLVSRVVPYRFLFGVILTLALASMATANDRVALVVGMGQYQSISPLKNTVNDAQAITSTLEGIGFEVTTLIDASLDELKETLDDFSFRSETADIAVIYFAGHGVEVQGENFLIPVDAQVASNLDVQRQSVSLDDMLAAVEFARKMRVVILDSCRDNPFGDGIDLTPTGETDSAATNTPASRGGGGLAKPSPDRGTLVAFAAKDGQVALDGAGNNSPFAQALIDKLAVPNLEISLMFRQVRDQVLAATRNLQEPHTYGSLSGVPFYLSGNDQQIAEIGVDDRREAWSALRPGQLTQLAALADTGDTRSMLGLAYSQLNPNSDQYDPAEAAKLFQTAADAGSPEAQFELGKLLEQGIGVPQDPAKALQLYQAAANQDFADAINDLGFLYFNGGLGLPRDQSLALRNFERAADLRHPEAMFNFAALIDDGLVTTKGPTDAARYLYRALRSGSTEVLNLLTERPTMFKPETRRALQEVLADNAFYSGGIDGDFGPGTQRGIRQAYGLVN